MADNKYGVIFTEADVLKIIEHIAEVDDATAADYLAEALESDIRFKFERDEPLFILRGRDKRAIGAIKFYSEHQSPRAPVNHLDAIDKALQSFIDYREANPGQMKEPD